MKQLFKLFLLGIFLSVLFLFDGHGEASFIVAMASLFILVAMILPLAIAKWFARREAEDVQLQQEKDAMNNETIARGINNQQDRNNIAAQMKEREWHECAEAIYLPCNN